MRPRANMRQAVCVAAFLVAAVEGAVPSVFSSTLAQSADAPGRVAKRSAQQVDIPSPIGVPPSQYWDGNDGPWSSFAVQLGTPQQYIRAFISTAAYVTWGVGPDGCPPGFLADCANKRGNIYYSNESLTYVPNSKYELGIENNLGLDFPAYAGFDTVTLGFKGSGGPAVSHSTVFAIDSSKLWLGGFGVNPSPANFSNMNDPQPSFMSQLFNNKSIPSLAYGYTAGNQYRFNDVYGSLILGGYDQNRFTSTNFSFPLGGDISRDLLVNLQSITTDAGSDKDLLPGGGIPIYLDSTVAQIWLPLDACEAFEKAFGITWDPTYNFYLVNSTQRTQLMAQNANVTFQLGTSNSGGETVDIVLPYAAFDLTLDYPNTPNSTYYFPLQRATNETQYTLGRTFFQEAYLIADYERRNFTVAPCLWDATKVQNELIRPVLSPQYVTDSSSSSGLSGGAIAGIVIGVVAALAIVASALFWVLRKRRRGSQRRVTELEAKEAEGHAKEAPSSIEGDASLAEQTPFTGDELDSAPVHEMSEAGQALPIEMASPHTADPTQHGYSEVEGGEHYGSDKHYAYEMDGMAQPVYEMDGTGIDAKASTTQPQLDRKDAPPQT